MGLRGIARRAGAARGAYMAEQEAYHRQRQDMADRIALAKDSQIWDMNRQKMRDAAAAEQRAQAAEQRAAAEFNANQEWLKKSRARQEKVWGQMNADRLTNQMRAAQKAELDLKIAQEKLNAAKNAQARRSEIWGIMTDDERIAAEYPYSRYAGDGMGLRTMGPMRQIGRMGTPASAGLRRGEQTRAVPAKPAVSDTRLKAVAEAVTPEQIQMAFNRNFYDTDANIQKRTGMSRDQFIKTLSEQYRAHILSAGENAMNEDDFIRQAAGRYGFWDRDDLGRLMNSINDASSKTPTMHGFYGFRRNEEEEYARRNPAFYKDQRKMIDDVLAIQGIDPQIKNMALRKPVFVRHYRMATEKGLSPDEAFRYAFHSVFGNYQNNAARPVNSRPRPSAPIPGRAPFSSDADIGLPPLPANEDAMMRRSDRYINWFNQAKESGYDIPNARRYAEYQYRRGA